MLEDGNDFSGWQQAEEGSRLLMKVFHAILGCFGIFVTVGYITLGRYGLAIVAAVCTGIQFWGAFRKGDYDG